jgi:hypothetical protein
MNDKVIGYTSLFGEVYAIVVNNKNVSVEETQAKNTNTI